MALSVIIGLFYTPVMIKMLGQSEYGLYNTVCSTISTLSVLSLGFNSSYVRYYAQYNKEKDKDSINRLNGLFILIFTVIGLIALLCGLYLTFNLNSVFDSGLSESEYETAKTLMFILTFNLAFSFPMSVFSSIISAHEKFVFLKILGLINTLVSPMVTLPLLFFGFRSVSLAVVAVCLNIFFSFIHFLYVVFVLNEKFVFHGFEKGLIKSLFTYTSFIAINMIIDQINWNVDKLLLARYKGTEAVSVYTVAYTFYNYYMSFSVAVSSVFTPRIHSIYNRFNNDISLMNKKLTELFIKVGRIQFILLSLLATGIVFFGKPFLLFWVGEGFEDSYRVALLLILPASVPLIQNLGIEIQRAENKHKFRSVVYLIMAILNFVLSVFLCQKYGAVGAAFGTALSLVFANGFIINIYYYKKCGIDIPLFWKNILRQSTGLIVPVLFGTICNKYIEFNSLPLLICGVVSYTFIYCISMWFLGMNKYEKQLVIVPLKKILNKLLPEKNK